MATSIKMSDVMNGEEDEEEEEEEDCCYYSEDEEYCRNLLRDHYGNGYVGESSMDALTPQISQRNAENTWSFSLYDCQLHCHNDVSVHYHEQRPLYDPLPDTILDRIHYQKWALDVSEIILQIMTFSTIALLLFHKYRMIVMRRMFFILGLLYGYRAITMFVTILPAANPSYHCAPKLVDSGRVLTVREVIKRVLKILSGFGLSINGKHVYCGDYIYSGHTMIAVLCYLIIAEYTDRRWYLFHYLVWLLAVTAIVMLMLARGHYSIDVIIAYYITTRLFWLYHSIAYFDSLKRSSQALGPDRSFNRFEKIWWWRLLSYFERNVHSGPLPNIYSLPFLRPKQDGAPNTEQRGSSRADRFVLRLLDPFSLHCHSHESPSGSWIGHPKPTATTLYLWLSSLLHSPPFKSFDSPSLHLEQRTPPFFSAFIDVILGALMAGLTLAAALFASKVWCDEITLRFEKCSDATGNDIDKKDAIDSSGFFLQIVKLCRYHFEENLRVSMAKERKRLINEDLMNEGVTASSNEPPQREESLSRVRRIRRRSGLEGRFQEVTEEEVDHAPRQVATASDPPPRSSSPGNQGNNEEVATIKGNQIRIIEESSGHLPDLLR
ncbi:SGMS [Lepeophtheirus salmonis]|uniref:SGMS n=1 Tax=Lepeophtheirus salmonis TaxID=72036 RepID=A0A7R8H0K6_LEPSM|nr:SGMS [Lepeophtheirus salmonis]CAF2791594.1 SGMS [Lepeophtheirus salmonis]